MQLQPSCPVAQCQHIVFPQIFDITHFESDLFGGTQSHVNRPKLSIRKDVAILESRPLRVWNDRKVRHPMVEENSSRAQQMPGPSEVERELVLPYVLKHADTDNFLKTAC